MRPFQADFPLNETSRLEILYSIAIINFQKLSLIFFFLLAVLATAQAKN
jgi:hypothetical protein